MENLIYSAISNAMSEIGAITKGSKNQQQGFMYRGIDAVMNALQPVLVNNKIFAIPEVLERSREDRATKSGGNLIYTILKVKYTFYASDGSSVSAIVVGEGMDSADKSSNKAMSIAFKYACFQILCIPTEETAPDPDKETHDIEPTKVAKNQDAPPKSETPKINYDKLRQNTHELACKIYKSEDKVKAFYQKIANVDEIINVPNDKLECVLATLRAIYDKHKAVQNE